MMGRGRLPERFLTTILFTDIVGSTDLAAKLGDREWRRVLAKHQDAVRRQLRRFGGHEIDTAGDGFLSWFDQPAQAVRAADTILREAAASGLTLRGGAHTGECEVIGRKVGGIAVHIAARVVGIAEPGEVVVSGTIRDLVAGSRLEFIDRGSHVLKGVPGDWRLFGLVREPDVQGETLAPTARSAAGAATPTARRGLVIAAGLALVGGLAIAALAAVLLSRPSSQPFIEPGPNTIVALSSDSADVAAVAGVPDGPVAIESDGDQLWVAALDDGVIVALNATNLGAGYQGTIGHVDRPTGLAVGNGRIWVADAFGQSVTLIDSTSQDVLDTHEDIVARRIAYGFDSAWTTDDISDRVLRLDRQSGDVAQEIALDTGAYPTGIAIGLAESKSIWIANAGTNTLARIDPTTASVTHAGIPLRFTPTEVAAGERDVWVVGRDDDVLVRVDPQTNTVSKTVDDVCDQPAALAVDAESVWVGCSGTPYEVLHIDRDGAIVARQDVGGVATDLIVVQGRVYVVVRRP